MATTTVEKSPVEAAETALATAQSEYEATLEQASQGEPIAQLALTSALGLRE